MYPYDPSDYYNAIPDIDGGAVAAVIAAVFAGYLLVVAVSVVMYIFHALGLYTIANRRQIRRPWLAWLPVGDTWILGSIADQYSYVVKGQVRSRRKVLVVLQIVLTVLGIAMAVVYVNFLLGIIMNVDQLNETMTEAQAVQFVLGPMLGVLGLALAMVVVSIIAAVIQYISYYQLFASCDPKNKTLFLVLSILFNVTLPFFVFACRKKDYGMPPRRPAPAPVWNPVQQPAQPAWQPPVQQPVQPTQEAPQEPWQKTEE